MKYVNLQAMLIAIKSLGPMEATGALMFHRPAAISTDDPTKIHTCVVKTEPAHELLHQAWAEVLRLRGEGWTKEDFARALRMELETPPDQAHIT